MEKSVKKYTFKKKTISISLYKIYELYIAVLSNGVVVLRNYWFCNLLSKYILELLLQDMTFSIYL